MTIFGRACIINTVGLTQFFYLASLIEFPEDKIKTIEQLVFKFIWRGRKPKVKKQTLINEIDEGGIKLIDLRSKIKALQTSWVVRYASKGDCLWRHIMGHYLKPMGDDLHFYCNCDIGLIKSLAELPDYYKQVLVTWSEITHSPQPTNVHDAKAQLIWKNRFIKINRESVPYKALFEAGVFRLNDLHYENNTLKPFQHWVDKGVEASSFLKWMSVIDAIPSEWKSLIKYSETSDTSHISKELKVCILGENFNLKSLKTKILYKRFVSKTALPPTSKEGLTSEFQILDEEWKNIYCLSGKTNVNKKIQELQYRILNKYLNTNVRLKKLDVINDDTCSFCKQAPETLEHLLITCKHVQKLWKDLLECYQQFSKEEISVNLRAIVLGWRTVDPRNLDNYILLSAKSLIYNCKISCKLPTLEYF